jgi:hypothetical protein
VVCEREPAEKGRACLDHRHPPPYTYTHTQIKARAEEWDGLGSEQQPGQDGGGGENSESVVVTFEVSPPDAHIAQFVVATSLVGPGPPGSGKALKVGG